MNRNRESTRPRIFRAAGVLLLLALVSQGCQFIQNEFWSY